MTFEEFVSEENIEVRDFGDKWKEKGYAAKTVTYIHGIYDWYWKFKENFNF